MLNHFHLYKGRRRLKQLKVSKEVTPLHGVLVIFALVSLKFSPTIFMVQICVEGPYKTRHIFGFSDRWLLNAA